MRFYSQGKNGYFRFIVTKNKELFILTLLFYGNLVLPHRISQFASWVKFLTEKNLWKNGSIQTEPILPTLKDSWLSGFTDAEGCFNVNIFSRNNTLSGNRVILRFMLDQKNVYEILIYIRNLFGFGRVSFRYKTNNVYRYSVNSFRGLNSVHDYFISYPLKFKKAISFMNWCKIYNMCLNKEHLNTEGLTKIREIIKTINVNNSINLNINTGSALSKNKNQKQIH